MSPAHIGFALIIALVWGLNFVVIKFGLDGLPPLFLAFARFFLTCIPAIFFFKRPNAPFQRVALYGLLIFALQFGLFFIGMNLGVPPGLASILMQVQVFFSLLYAILFFKEKMRGWQIAGALISFSGIAYVGLHLGGAISIPGFFLVLAAAAFWGTGSAISKTLGPVNMVSLVVWGSLVACPILGAASLLIEGPDLIRESLKHLSWLSIGAVLYLTYLSTFLGYGLWSWLIHHHPLSTVAPFTMLVPVIAMISSSLILGEPMQAWKIEASILVIGGLSINFLAPRFFGKKSKKDSEPPVV